MKFDYHQEGFVGVKVFYREPDLAYPNHGFKTCGGPEAFTSTKIFKRSEKTSSRFD